MKTRRAMFAAPVVAVTLSLAGGCASYYYPDYPTSTPLPSAQVPAPLGIGDLIAMLQAGRAQRDVIADVQAYGVQAPPTPADIDALLAAGANPDLIVAVQGARIGTAVPAEASIVQTYPAAPAVSAYPYGDPFYPWFPFSWGFGWGYSSPSYGYRPPYYRPPYYRPPYRPDHRPAPHVGPGPGAHPGHRDGPGVRPGPVDGWGGRPAQGAGPGTRPAPGGGPAPAHGGGGQRPGAGPAPGPQTGTAPAPRPPSGPGPGARPAPSMGKPIPSPSVIPGKRSQ